MDICGGKLTPIVQGARDAEPLAAVNPASYLVGLSINGYLYQDAPIVQLRSLYATRGLSSVFAGN